MCIYTDIHIYIYIYMYIYIYKHIHIYIYILTGPLGVERVPVEDFGVRGPPPPLRSEPMTAPAHPYPGLPGLTRPYTLLPGYGTLDLPSPILYFFVFCVFKCVRLFLCFSYCVDGLGNISNLIRCGGLCGMHLEIILIPKIEAKKG